MNTLLEWIILNKVAIISAFVFLATISGACAKINKYFNLPNDNVIEQNIEEVIEEETGIEIDLTPKEKDNATIERQ